jgi:uncharacterized protein (DUF2147 family)
MERLQPFLFLLLVPTLLCAQNPTGKWTTIDDHTGKPRSVVDLQVTNGVLSGRIVDLLERSNLDKRCGKCPDDRKDQRIVGLEIIRGMRLRDGTWSGGTILDPESGKIYDCKLWIENGRLLVRGYVAFFFRTQEWVR